MSREQLQSLLRHAPRYELGAAIRLLLRAGYTWSDIRFEGIRELCATRGPIIRGIRLEGQCAKTVIVSLNAGLLSPGSPLPGYFKEFALRLPDPDAFLDFVGFWDALQLSILAYAAWPDLAADRKRLLGKTYRSRLRWDSPIALHWLFRSLFPELGVEIDFATFSRRTLGDRARVGGILDGRLVIGSEFLERRPGFRVRLRAEAAKSDAGFDWEQEAETRLGRICKILEKSRKPIEVVLDLEQYRYGHQLVGPENPRRQLGVRPWLPSDPQANCGPGQVTLRKPWG